MAAMTEHRATTAPATTAPAAIDGAATDAATLQPAQIDWRQQQPWSTQFQDIYYQPNHGSAECHYVFIEQNQLEQRWQSWSRDSAATFVIAETGFGSGLNFLLAAELFLATAPSAARLQFVSTELHPLQQHDLARAVGHCCNEGSADLQQLGAELLAGYPPLVAGQHSIELAGGRVQLLLLFGDALTSLRQLAAPQRVNAWFLDGFAPAKNPAMWRPELFHCMAALSAPQCSFATFTAAGDVRRGLAGAGFTVNKVPGFGDKRDMLSGTFAAVQHTLHELPWHRGYLTATDSTARSAVIIGAGIAGCSTARALALRGYRVTVVDRHGAPAQAGSGNRQAVVYPKLSLRDEQLPQINLASLLYASRYYRSHWQAQRGQQCGVLVLAEAEQAGEFAAIAARYQPAQWIQRLSRTELRQVSGLALHSDSGLWFEQLGWLQPQAVCTALLDHPLITLSHAEVSRCQFDHSSAQWQLFSDSGAPIAAAQQLVLASGIDSNLFSQTAQLPFKPIRGQVTHLHRQQLRDELNCVICAEGYVAPAQQQLLTLGASYRRDCSNTELSSAEHRHNLAQLSDCDAGLQQWLADIDPQHLPGRANFRATTPDYLPLVGAVPDVQAMCQRYAFLTRDAKQVKPLEGAYHPQLFMLAGLGSRGFSYAPLMSELLAAIMTGEVAPLPSALCQALHPARFVIRDLKRNRLQRYDLGGN